MLINSPSDQLSVSEVGLAPNGCLLMTGFEGEAI